MCDCCGTFRPDDRFTVTTHPTGHGTAYTVGLTRYGLPELVVTGLRLDLAGELLCCCGYLLDEQQVLPGEHLDWGPFLMEAVQVDRPDEHLPLARQRYGAVRALQLVWTDRPDHAQLDLVLASDLPEQRLLGTRAPWFCADHARDRLDVPPHL